MSRPTRVTRATLGEQVAAALGGREIEPIEVPSSGGVRVQRRSLRFLPGDPEDLPAGTPNTYSCKALVDVGGVSLFAELAVVRLFQQAGWSAYWRDGFGRGWVGDGDLALRRLKELPDSRAQKVISDVASVRGGTGGCWDVVAWCDLLVAFAECKRLGGDRLRDSQGKWLRASLEAGLSPDAFVVVEWDTVPDDAMADHAAALPRRQAAVDELVSFAANLAIP